MSILSNIFGGDAPKLKMKSTTSTGLFGTGTYNPKTGKQTYELAPELQQMQDIYYGAAQQFLPTQASTDYANYLQQTGQGILNQAIGMSPQEYAAQLYQQGSDILAPQREQEAAMLADKLFKTGRFGAATGYGEGYINPEQFTLLSAYGQSDKQRLFDTIAQAYDRQNREQLRGLGLMEAGQQQRMLPYQQAQQLFGVGTGIAGLGQNDIQNLYNYANMTNQQQLAKYNADMANWQASGGGLFSSIANSLASGLGAGLGGKAGGALGNWVSSLSFPSLGGYSVKYTPPQTQQG